MHFLHPEHDEQLELSLDDVFLLPGYFEGTSRLGVDLTPTDFRGGSHPIVSANMNAVTGKRMAETMARYGGLGVLPQDMALETVERIAQHVKHAHPRFDTALSVTASATVRDVQGIIRKRAHGMVVVIDEGHRPIGILTQADLTGCDQYASAHAVMSRNVVSLSDQVDNREAFATMEKHRLRAAPVVNCGGQLIGVLTRADAVRLEVMRPTLSPEGQLMVAAAVGIASSGITQQAGALIEMGLSALVIDTAHGHQRRMLEAIAAVRKIAPRQMPIIAGNVCTTEGTRALIEAGADIIKVNVGPGAMCTTRMQTGVGRPSFSSVLACARAAKALGKHVWADGGVRKPRDVALYLAAGASRVMVGTAFAGTYESPGDIVIDSEGRSYKENYGMASARAVEERTRGLGAFEVAQKRFFREGISTSRIYLRPGEESVGAALTHMITGLQSALTYVGATDLEAFTTSATVGVQTRGGFVEGTPHGQVFG